MPRPRNSIPKFSIDRNGRAFTKVDGRFVSLGRGDNPESRRRYAVLLTEHTGLAVTASTATEKRASVTVNELLLRFVTEELPRYSTSEQYCQKTVVRLLRQLFGETLVSEFGPLRLRVVRKAMVDGDPTQKDQNGKPCPRKPWSRDTVNRNVKRIQAIFRWGVSWEIVPETVAASLGTVRILAAGETAAAESTPRRSVSKSDIEAVRRQLTQRNRDILDLLGLTGARPGELLSVRAKDLNQDGEVWRFDLIKHKTAHKGKSRTLFFNSKAQAILQRYITDDPEARLFPIRRDSFGHAVLRACTRAGIEPFVPHEIRHTTATKLVDEVGIESAQRLLGHSDQAMTQHYSRTADRQAVEAVKTLE
ncbi:tyrosine-type recombinase/integrase [Schlesneria sp. DSM 10557]|uniref:tyrosine-type recombinase/integrase n=1 Tax=Schlesneria sp. DSM 10557 TaxID=3044399 RepID=UPI0035A1C363